MNRSTDVLGMAAACVLSLSAVLAGCAQHDQTTVASSPAVLAGRSAIVDGTRGASDEASSVDGDGSAADRDASAADRDASAVGGEASAGPGDLPVVVITGHREGWRSLILSERNPGPRRD